MNKLLAVMLSASLMLAGANAYADDTAMKKDATFQLAMTKDMKSEPMSSPVVMDEPGKGTVTKKKKHHKRKSSMKK